MVGTVTDGVESRKEGDVAGRVGGGVRTRSVHVFPLVGYVSSDYTSAAPSSVCPGFADLRSTPRRSERLCLEETSATQGVLQQQRVRLPFTRLGIVMKLLQSSSSCLRCQASSSLQDPLTCVTSVTVEHFRLEHNVLACNLRPDRSSLNS